MALWIKENTLNQISQFVSTEYLPRLESKLKNWYGGTYQYWSRKILLRTSLDQASSENIRYGYRCSSEDGPIIFFGISSYYLSIRYHSLISSFKNIALEGKYCIYKDSPDYLEFRYAFNPADDNAGAKVVADELVKIAETFDPLIDKWLSEQEDKYFFLSDAVCPYEDPIKKYTTTHLTFEPSVPLHKIDFGSLSLPNYQRTYKWGIPQVNQLINDLLQFTREINCGKSKAQMYHLGTLVLNNGDIVDGQQRLITISLLLYVLSQIPEIREYSQNETKIVNLFPSIKSFFLSTTYKSLIARKNIAKNYRAMIERSSDLDIDFFRTLVFKCQFAIVIVPTRSESFQFFDSQNARGCDLQPHDLLKAFHLREIPDSFKSEKDYSTLIQSWQAKKPKELARFFLCAFRIKRWGKSEWGAFFTKDDVHEFKGVSFGNGEASESFPFYAQAKQILSFLKGKTSEFPFQLDGAIVNGQAFFEMVIKYYNLYECVIYPESFKTRFGEGEAYSLLCRLDTDNKKNRTGDAYVRDFFNASLMYYLDKFGGYEINKAIFKLFIAAYSIRLTSSRVSLSTIDNEGVAGESIFKLLRNSKSPYDILNMYFESIRVNDKHITQSETIVNEFINLGKIIDDGQK